MNRRPNEEEMLYMDKLNKEVDEAISKRSNWLTKNMIERASLSPGDDIYDLEKGYLLGVVVKIDRYKGSHKGIYDNHFDFHYVYKNTNSSMNTTDNIYSGVGSKKEMIEYQENKLHCELERLMRLKGGENE